MPKRNSDFRRRTASKALKSSASAAKPVVNGRAQQRNAGVAAAGDANKLEKWYLQFQHRAGLSLAAIAFFPTGGSESRASLANRSVLKRAVFSRTD